MSALVALHRRTSPSTTRHISTPHRLHLPNGTGRHSGRQGNILLKSGEGVWIRQVGPALPTATLSELHGVSLPRDIVACGCVSARHRPSLVLCWRCPEHGVSDYSRVFGQSVAGLWEREGRRVACQGCNCRLTRLGVLARAVTVSSGATRHHLNTATQHCTFIPSD
ncbi:hypothetical protein E2C01_036616 [Portunus trituberculatus]|uniref:Uncharacterized protein n=1 Tax=Portunus trituberculatus TaxID=210409 RepID=A0A5B7FCJ8_PORTR|nr:hypothetical protein [Portunus trituberculatus]